MKGIVIAGTHSGSGKTTITLGVLAAFNKKGYKVQPFKTGPDFIDTGLHKLVTGRTSRNLDLWMCGKDYVTECFHRHASDADMAVVEGVMGMYDGNISTADLGAVLGLPIVLVVDAYGMAESAGAVVKGFAEYGNRKGKARLAPTLSGIIFNRVASERHYRRLKDSVHDIPVLGYLPRDLDFTIPHRHLGLTIAEEAPFSKKEINKLADAVIEYIDIEAIMNGQEARGKGQGEQPKTENIFSPLTPRPLDPSTPSVKIAVAYDRAFCFYYEDNMELLMSEGAEIVMFSPLSDSTLPAVDALYIGGGYPELHAAELSNNRAMIESIRGRIDSGMPAYGECGGFMYLTEGIYDFENTFHSMVGTFPMKTKMTEKRAGLGYREAIMQENSILGRKGASVRGHEFHYSEIVENGEAQKKLCRGEVPSPLRLSQVYSVKDGSGNDLKTEGYKAKNVLGSYIHIHFGSNPSIAQNFVNLVKEYHGKDTYCRSRQS